MSSSHPPPPRHWTHPETIRIAANTVLLVAGSWFLLGELKAVLRPLLLAVFLGYVLMPYYGRLRKKMPAMLALGFVAIGVILVFLLLASTVTGNLIDITAEGPALKQKAVNLIRGLSTWVQSLPMVPPRPEGGKPPEEVLTDRLADEALSLLNLVAVSIPEAVATGLYLMFLLLESARFPAKVRKAYPSERAEHILNVFGRINAAIISYLKAKFLSSLLIGVLVGVLLGVAGVRFAVLWAVLTFVCNFIPYVGSVVAYALPTGFAVVQWGPSVGAFVVAALMAAVHLLSASVFEPMLLGRAVGLSPLVILAALTVWGVLWGLPGMFLAVPLTVVVKIVFENIEVTKPLANLLSEE
jgi:AI-2 transport protein TqsA